MFFVEDEVEVEYAVASHEPVAAKLKEQLADTEYEEKAQLMSRVAATAAVAVVP